MAQLKQGTTIGGNVVWHAGLNIPNSGLTNSALNLTAGGGLSGGGSVSLGNSITINHADTSTQGNVNTSGGTIIDYVNTDGYGHVTGMGTRNLSYSDVGAASAGHDHNGDTIYPNTIYIGDNGSADSNAYFYDDNSNTWRTFQWDDSISEWRVEDNGGSMRRLYHEGHKPTTGEIGAAPSSHNHSAGDITSGSLSYSRLPSSGGEWYGNFGTNPLIIRTSSNSGSLFEVRSSGQSRRLYVEHSGALGTSNDTIEMSDGSTSFNTTDVSNWKTAHGWGNHANAGYLTSHPNISSGGDVNTSGATIIDNIYTDGNGHVTSHGTRNLSASDIGAASSGHNHNGDHIYPNAISVGDNGSADSYIRFYDDNSNAWRVLRWDDSRNNWAVEDNGGTHRLLYHEGHKPTLSELGAASDSHNHDGRYALESGDTFTGNVNFNGGVTQFNSGGNPRIAIETNTSGYGIIRESVSSSNILSLESYGGVQVVIDNNNNDTDKVFAVKANSRTSSPPFTVNETGQVKVKRGGTYPLQLWRTGNNGPVGIWFRDNDANTQTGYFTYDHRNSNSEGNGASFHFNSSEATLGVIIDGAGSYYGDDFITSSDRRVKKDIENIDNVLSLFKPINLHSFQKKGRDYREIGLIAQEVQKAHPLLVRSTPHEEYGEILNLSAHSIASLAVGGVKELIGRTDTMASETDKLKKKVADQQEQINDLKEKLEELK